MGDDAGWWFGCGPGLEESAGGVGDAGDVGVGDLLEVPARGGRSGGVAAGEPFAEFGHGADADARVGAVQAGPQRFGQRRGDDGGSGGVAGEQDLSFGPVQPALRGLRGAGGLDLVEDVGVGVVDRDVPVVVGVGGAGAQALDQGGGEHRPGRAGRVGGVAFEGVLGGGGGGQHHPAAALAEEAVPQAEVGLALGAVGERAAEAGIQDQDLAAGPAVLQLVQHPGRLDPGRPEPVLAGVGGGEVQPAAGIQQPVAGQVDQQQVPGAPAVQEVLDGQPDLLGRLVDHGGDGEAADARVGQDLRQVGGVPGRGAQPAQPGVGVRAVATTRASRAPGGGSAAGGMAGQPGIDDLLLLLRGRAGHLQHIPADADLHGPARPRGPPAHGGHHGAQPVQGPELDQQPAGQHPRAPSPPRGPPRR